MKKFELITGEIIEVPGYYKILSGEKLGDGIIFKNKDGIRIQTLSDGRTKSHIRDEIYYTQKIRNIK